MQLIYDLKFEELQEILQENKIGKFRATQIWNWLYINHVSSFNEMTNVDKKTREFLEKNFYFNGCETVKELTDDDGTRKLLLKLEDGETIETVLMEYKHGYSVCVTTQIGCSVGCSFCASGIDGYKRNLTSGEIVEQVVLWNKILQKDGDRVKTVVVMGIGEPFLNYDNVIKFIDIINDQKGLKIGARHITVSTSGIVPGILKLADYDKQVNLAISLHAPNDNIRSKIMLINDKYSIKQIISSVKEYIEKTNRRVSFEYIMLDGINDREHDAYELVRLLRGLNCHVNLIPFNEVEEFLYKRSSNEAINEFYEVLLDHNIQVTKRRAKGKNIDGACGQLRRNNEH